MPIGSNAHRASLAGLGLIAIGLTFGGVASSGPAMAQDVSGQDVSGTWLRDSGASRVRFAKCGDAICGTLAWLKETNGPAKVGQRIFYDMKPSGDGKWAGSAFNPEDGKTYSGTMSLSGDALTTSGCVMGGLICRSVKWTRAN